MYRENQPAGKGTGQPARVRAQAGWRSPRRGLLRSLRQRRLAFFDDCREEAIKYVNLEVGGIYDIAYEGNDGRIYENRAKVMQIEDNRNNFHSRPRRDYVRETRKEHIGFNNAIYIDQTKNKDEFMTGVPVRDIEIIVDTSEFFTGCYESISLSAIRDVTLVEEDEVESCREY